MSTAHLKAAPSLLTLSPWYETRTAREVLELCVENPPFLHHTPTREIEAGAVFHQYDPADPRVVRLRDIRNSYGEAVEQACPELARATRFDIGVSEAIDLALEAAKNAARTEALRERLLARGLTLGEVRRRMQARAA